MNSKSLIIIALVLGLLASFMISRLMSNGLNAHSSLGVIVASAKIDSGKIIDKSELRIVDWPKTSIPEGSFQNIEKLQGRVTRQPIPSGAPVIESMLAPVDAKGGLSSTIEIGKRAITVNVNEVVAVAGFALPGSFVDVLASVKTPSGEIVSKTVLTRVKVLAVAQETSTDSTKPKVVSAVTLELTPKESEALDLARSAGTLSLSLRNELDDKRDVSSGTHFSELFGNSRAVVQEFSKPEEKKSVNSKMPSAVKPVKSPKENKSSVEIISGTSRSEVHFDAHE